MKKEININKTGFNIFSECKMTGYQNRLLNVIQEGKEILEDLEAMETARCRNRT